ncbi:MAG: signal recognition particle protein [Dethiobacter sp.]|jgi:signal recognition particle subunit SRP54|nr:signal recognition particle protein [Dethiobacter sp.]
MFANLADKLQQTLKNLRGKGKLSEKDVDAAMREIRLALLEADVNFKVVKDFVVSIRERAVGQEVMGSLTPGQQVVKIVHQELTRLMGREQSRLSVSSHPPTVIMMVGLQGSGKTTTSVKLALQLRKAGRNPLLAAADIYRPGAVRQLEVLCKSADLPCYSENEAKPEQICLNALRFASREGKDHLIIDTAGRLHLDEAMMAEIKVIKAAVKPTELLLVVDAMTGQDAVNAAAAFHQAAGLTGVILTKLDGDTRGGAALSVRAVTGCPIKYAGVGEKIDALEPFYPERMASRILGMGDVLSLIEKAEAALDKDKARELEKKLRRQELTLEDFRDQLKQLRSMGNLEQILDLLPGGAGIPAEIKNISLSEQQFTRVEAIISSMTKAERLSPVIINSSRRRRIAQGSGTTVQDVNRLLNQFAQMQKMFKQMGNLEKLNKLKKFKKGKKGFPFF